MTTTTFVTTTIQNAWGRAATQSEITQYVNQINGSSSQTPRVDFLNTVILTNSAFTQSTNSNPQWISALYYTILVRDPDQAGFNFWVSNDTNPPGEAGIYYEMPGGAHPAAYAVKLATIGQAVPPNLNLLGFLGSPEFQALIQGAATPVNLGAFYNRAGIWADGSTFSITGGLDGAGNAYSGNLLSSPQTWNGSFNGATFSLGPCCTSDVVSAAGNVIPLPAGQFSSLRMLAAGVNGNQPSQSFTVNYSDGCSTTFTQSLSNWIAPQGFQGESNALQMAYRDSNTGAKSNLTVNVYGYSFTLNNTKIVNSVTLPNNGNVEVLGLALVP